MLDSPKAIRYQGLRQIRGVKSRYFVITVYGDATTFSYKKQNEQLKLLVFVRHIISCVYYLTPDDRGY